MKLKILLIASILALASSAFAQFFPGRSVVVILPSNVTVEVYNPHYQPIICHGQVFGQTNMGLVANAFFNPQLVLPGRTINASVSAGFNFFTTGWATVQCQFAL